MLGWAAGFLVIALVAAPFAFTALVGAVIGVAQVIFWIFIALFVVSVVLRRINRRPPR